MNFRKDKAPLDTVLSKGLTSNRNNGKDTKNWKKVSYGKEKL